MLFNSLISYKYKWSNYHSEQINRVYNRNIGHDDPQFQSAEPKIQFEHPARPCSSNEPVSHPASEDCLYTRRRAAAPLIMTASGVIRARLRHETAVAGPRLRCRRHYLFAYASFPCSLFSFISARNDGWVEGSNGDFNMLKLITSFVITAGRPMIYRIHCRWQDAGWIDTRYGSLVIFSTKLFIWWHLSVNKSGEISIFRCMIVWQSQVTKKHETLKV